MTEDDICWPDQVGNRWEAEGIDPGRIFETGRQLTDDCLPGVMVATKEHMAPGVAPTSIFDVRYAVVVLKSNEEISLVTAQGYRPVLVANWARISENLG